jgi:hypothetical protein
MAIEVGSGRVEHITASDFDQKATWQPQGMT